MAFYNENATSPKVEIPQRTPLLTNSAAEFVENRADVALGPEFAGIPAVFSPELDCFVHPDDAPNPDYFHESGERLEKFRRTLDAFKDNLSKRQVLERIDIDIKEPTEYTFNDVLKIAQEVQKKHKDADKIHSTMGRIRKLFRVGGRNAATVKKLLAFVPSDAYGSMICGGFTLILAGLERAETLRTDMYESLGNIPKTLHRIHDLLDVHFKSARLKFCADSILVAMFVLMELIIKELTGSTSKRLIKVPFKGESYGSEIDEAVASLNRTVDDFEAEARLCDSQRIGQTSVVTQRTHITTKHIDETTQRTDTCVGEISSNLAEFKECVKQNQDIYNQNQVKLIADTRYIRENMEEKEKEVGKNAPGTNVVNNFYFMFAASPHMDPIKGTARHIQEAFMIARSATPTSTSKESDYMDNAIPFNRKSREAAEKWIQSSDDAPKVVTRDRLACFQDLGYRPGLVDHDRVLFILSSDDVREWIQSSKSALLVIDLPQSFDTMSVASYASAMLVSSIENIGACPVLYQFLRQRSMDLKHADLAGETGMLVSLIAQLLSHLLAGPGINIEFLESERFKKARKDPSRLFLIFERLLERIPTNRGVFILLDDVGTLKSKAKREEEGVLGKVLALIGRGDLLVKILISGPSSSNVVRSMKANHQTKRRVSSLYVPEHVEGRRNGFNAAWVENEIKELLRECETTSESSLDSESSSDSESDLSD